MVALKTDDFLPPAPFCDKLLINLVLLFHFSIVSSIKGTVYWKFASIFSQIRYVESCSLSIPVSSIAEVSATLNILLWAD